MPQHVHQPDERWPVSVADLLEQALKDGRPLRLHWINDNTWLSPREYPTAVLPRITGETDSPWKEPM
ncbi:MULTISPECIES: hypothetical protein [unclassified Crossiella]|uniref:hypothetical protein n=1 Tax=unclassified Crossiella TaxID=2620835 RepID=UPI001FFEBA13|nr:MULTISPECIES: hypothetical protein [unclassified Crossiella]MCK2240041.1 hypothetical protein [Crossiella sp. S99.2]MCK2252749.1 hypothetical protein [Crossiella sp. S99.1]